MPTALFETKRNAGARKICAGARMLEFSLELHS